MNNEEDSIQSDHHPFFTLLMASKGTRGSIQDNVWSKRFYYAELLKEYGANITISQNRVQIDGPPRWVGRSEVVSGNDVRTSAVLVLLGTQLDRPLFLDGAHHLSRGYVGLVKNLARLGADIEVYIPSLRLVS